MPDNNPLQTSFLMQQSGISPEQYQKLMAAQQQEALANALLSEGTTPVSTEGRSIGGVGYAISPWEGAAKLGQMLSGKYQQNNANAALANALAPSSGNQPSGSQDPIVQAMPPQTQALYNRLMLPETMGGSPRAGMELYNTYAASMKAYGSGVGTAAAANAPVGGGAPGIPGYQPQPAPLDAAAEYRQQNGMQTPPIDTQRQGTGLPIGSNVPMGQIPPINASALKPPPAPIPSMPKPSPGETNAQYEARLSAAKAGATAQSTEHGKNIEEAVLNSAQINARIDNAKKNITEMLGVADKTSTGVPFVSDETQNDFLQRFDHPTAKANALMEQKSNQLYVQELAPLIKQLGSRGNQFVERAVKAGSAVDMRDNPETKKAVLNGLYEYLDNIQKNTVNQQQILQGQIPNAPASGTPAPDTSGWSIKRVQ